MLSKPTVDSIDFAAACHRVVDAAVIHYWYMDTPNQQTPEEEATISPELQKTTITGIVEVGEAHGSTIIGVKQGLDEGRMLGALDKFFDEKFAEHEERLISLLSSQGPEHPLLAVKDPIADALFECRCKATQSTALGFAVNNSGLIICPSAVKAVDQVRQLTSGKRFSPQSLSSFTMLQALQIQHRTRGLIPAYRSPQLGEQLYAFNTGGKRCALSVRSIDTDVKVTGGEESGKRAMYYFLFEIVVATYKSTDGLIGGPVMSKAHEVVGIAVAASPTHLIIQPWSQLESCINMNWHSTHRVGSTASSPPDQSVS